jgi:F0F1-type ATP synthase membrane subunit a
MGIFESYLSNVLEGVLVAMGVWVLSSVIGIIKSKIVEYMKRFFDMPQKNAVIVVPYRQ